MTPIEIFEYKLKWLPGYQVTLHSDLRQRGLGWCRQGLNSIHWKHTLWTDVYEDTFHFEKSHDASDFLKEFPKYSKLIQNNR